MAVRLTPPARVVKQFVRRIAIWVENERSKTLQESQGEFVVLFDVPIRCATLLA
jgi:hypothetical protein